MKLSPHLFAISIVFLSMLGSYATPLPIHLSQYIIPDGHRGPLIMVLHNGHGQKLPATPATWTFKFSKNGILVVDWDTYLLPNPLKPPKDHTPVIKANFSNGVPLLLQEDAGDNQVAFRGLYGVGKGVEPGITSTGAVYYFVGTRPAADEFMRQQELKFQKAERDAATKP